MSANRCIASESEAATPRSGLKTLRTASGLSSNLAGNQFVRSPHLTLNVGADYTVPLGDKGKLQFAADARYTSLQYYYVNPQNTVSRYLLTQPGYTLANARVTYTTQNEKISASFFVNNLLDTVYRNHALPAFAPGINGDTVQYGDPRTIGGSLIYRF